MLPSWACITGFGTGAARLIPRRVSGPGLAEVSAEWIKDESFDGVDGERSQTVQEKPSDYSGQDVA